MKNLFFITLALFISSIVFSQGNCNEADLQYLSENAESLTTLTTDCTNSCLGDPNSEACVQACILEATPLSESCAACFSSQVACVVDNCFLTCLFGSEEDCQACAIENCLEDFNACAGIVDQDEDSFDTLTDCDDSNPAVYPNAPGTGEGIDNNCDGVISGGELVPDFCGADLNQNGLVEVADLTILLGDYGNLSPDAEGDVDGIPGCTSSDLSAFLSVFGNPC